jgi:hypothetical protein
VGSVRSTCESGGTGREHKDGSGPMPLLLLLLPGATSEPVTGRRIWAVSRERRRAGAASTASSPPIQRAQDWPPRKATTPRPAEMQRALTHVPQRVAHRRRRRLGYVYACAGTGAGLQDVCACARTLGAHRRRRLFRGKFGQPNQEEARRSISMVPVRSGRGK